MRMDVGWCTYYATSLGHSVESPVIRGLLLAFFWQRQRAADSLSGQWSLEVRLPY